MRRKLSTAGTLVFGLPLLALATWLAWDTYVAHGDRNLTAQDLTTVVGDVDRTIEVHRSRGSSLNEVWLKGYDYPFRFENSPVLARLSPGSTLQIGIQEAELKAPRNDWSRNETFYAAVTAQTPDGRYLINLDSYNHRASANRAFIPWIIFLLVFAGIYLSLASSMKELARGGPYTGYSRSRHSADEPLDLDHMWKR